MSDRPEYVTCVRRKDNPARSWCGRAVGREFHFVDAEHAVRNFMNQGRLTVCPECRREIILALGGKQE